MQLSLPQLLEASVEHANILVLPSLTRMTVCAIVSSVKDAHQIPTPRITCFASAAEPGSAGRSSPAAAARPSTNFSHRASRPTTPVSRMAT